MPGVLAFSEKDELGLQIAALAIGLSGPSSAAVNAAVLGPDAVRRATSYFERGLSTVYVNEDRRLDGADTRAIAGALHLACQLSGSDTVLLSSTRKGRETASRLAQAMGAICVTNALSVESGDGQVTVTRYGLGGSTIITERLAAAKKVIALLPRETGGAASRPAQGQLVQLDLAPGPPPMSLVERRERAKDAVDIVRAKALVSIGSGLKAKEDLRIVEELAGALGAEIGCTKPLASNRGWLSEDRVIGVSGKRCRPRLAVCIGTSGQSQHMAGLADAVIIVAINNDRAAPVFKAADFALVGDLYKVAPLITAVLKQRKKA